MEPSQIIAIVGILAAIISFGFGMYVAHCYHIKKREKEYAEILKELDVAENAFLVAKQRVCRQLGIDPDELSSGRNWRSLQSQLQEAIDNEDYEEAARIRDLMKKG